MNVTKEIQQNHIVYGASDYTAPSGLAASKSLNYAKGPTITNPERVGVTVVPSSFRYADSVGLFGAENYFLKVDLNVTEEVAKACFEEEGWECAMIKRPYIERDPNYNAALIDFNEFPTVNTYEQAIILNNRLPVIDTGYLSVDLTNIKSGNMYTDDWLDVRLYTQNREEHPYDKMYVGLKGWFYIGVHARNTKRLPYDISCVIGQEFRSYDSIEDKSLIMRR